MFTRESSTTPSAVLWPFLCHGPWAVRRLPPPPAVAAPRSPRVPGRGGGASRTTPRPPQGPPNWWPWDRLGPFFGDIGQNWSKPFEYIYMIIYICIWLYNYKYIMLYIMLYIYIYLCSFSFTQWIIENNWWSLVKGRLRLEGQESQVLVMNSGIWRRIPETRCLDADGIWRVCIQWTGDYETIFAEFGSPQCFLCRQTCRMTHFVGAVLQRLQLKVWESQACNSKPSINIPKLWLTLTNYEC